MIVTTEAIILKSRKFRESSKLVTLYTEEFGKCTVVANGARRAKNKFGSALEPLSCSTVTFYKHPQKDLHTLSNAEIAIPLRRIPESFDLLTTGMTILETVYNTQLDEEQNPDLYIFLKHTLVALNTCERNPETLLFLFQFHLAFLMGFGVNPLFCPETSEPVRPDQSEHFIVSLADGAPFCPDIALHRTGFRIEAGTLAILQRFTTMKLEDASSLSLSHAQITQLQDFFALYFEYHLGKRLSLRTVKFLHNLP